MAEPTESIFFVLPPLEPGGLIPDGTEYFRVEPGLPVFFVVSNIPELEELLGMVLASLAVTAVPLGVLLVLVRGSPFLTAFFWILGEVDFGRGSSDLELGVDCSDLEPGRASLDVVARDCVTDLLDIMQFG